MAHLNNEQIKQQLESVSEGPVTEKDLGVIKVLNNLSTSGQINSIRKLDINFFLTGKYKEKLDSLEDTKKWDEYEYYKYTLITSLLNWSINKFKWEGFQNPFTGEELERLLFLFGKCVVFKFQDELFVTNFTIDKYDVYRLPKIIKPVLNNGKVLKPLRVNKDCIIIANDSSWPFARLGVFGSLFRVWPLINKVTEAWRLISRNMLMSRQWLAVEFGISQENLNTLKKNFESNSYILQIDNDFMSKLTTSQNNNTLSFEDKTDMVWNNFYNLKEELKWTLGIETNSNVNKKERQINKEIDSQNEIPWAQTENRLINREKSVDLLNKLFNVTIKVSLRKRPEDGLGTNDKNDMNQKKDIGNKNEKLTK